jgi:DNA-binding CsgD family transcriptional regulator/PAS domain-containing protein
VTLDIVPRLYDAAAGEDDWSDVLDRVRKAVDADALFLGAGDPRSPEELEFWGPGWDPALPERAGYQSHDLWDPTVNPAVPAGMIMPVERSFDHRQVIPEATSLASDFIQRTVYAAGYAQHRLFVPMRDGSVLSGGFVGKGRNRAFDPVEIERLDVLLPHLGRALRLRHQIARHGTVERGLSDLLDRMEKAVFLIDRNLTVLFVNGVAEDLVRRGAGIAILRGRLSLSKATPALKKAVSEIETGMPTAGRPPVIPIDGSPEMPSLVAGVYPGTGFAAVRGARRVAASIIVEMPRQADPPDAAEVMRAFGLTPAEAAVAREIPVAASRRGIAEALGLQENTVKTHLASIRAKTGAGNMVELAMILERAAGPR